MQLIRSFREQYASFGIPVIAAYCYLLLVGGIWLWVTKSWPAAVFLIIMAALFYFKNKLANLITGVVFLFLSIGLLLEVLSKIGDPNVDVRLKLVISICNVIFSGILIVSFQKAALKEIDSK